MSKILLVSTLLTFILSGCSFTKTKYVIKKQTRYISLPDKYVTDDVELPGISKSKKRAYVNASPIVRGKMDAKLINRLYGTIGTYKVKLKNIRTYEERMRETLNRENSKTTEEIKRVIDEVGKENVVE